MDNVFILDFFAEKNVENHGNFINMQYVFNKKTQAIDAKGNKVNLPTDTFLVRLEFQGPVEVGAIAFDNFLKF